MTRIITLLTDYGDRDYYVAALKGTILSVAPHVNLVDITHQIEPQNVAASAFVLRNAINSFPAETIHVAVVDPDVGSHRRILLARYGGHYFIAPDNGLLSWVNRDLPREGLWSIENAAYCAPRLSTTFHGRDIMAPAAGHLANGAAPESFGPPLEAIQLLPIPFRARADANGLRGEVLYVDRFGTLVSNIHTSQLRPEFMAQYRVHANGAEIGRIQRAFYEVPHGSPVAYIGSEGFLEVAVYCGSAFERFRNERSVEIIVQA